MMLVLAIVEIFSVILQRIFCDSTLKKKKIRRYTDYLVWGGYFAVFNGVTYVLTYLGDGTSNIWLNILLFVCIFFVTIRILYTDSVRTLMATTIFMYMSGMCAELLVYYGKEFLAWTDDAEVTLLCTVLSKIVWYLIIKFTSLIIKLNRKAELNLQDWLEVFIVPVCSIWILISVFITGTLENYFWGFIVVFMILLINVFTYYLYDKAKLIVREMAEILMFRLTEKKLVTESITLEVGYDRENVDKGGYRGLTQTDRYGRVIPKAAHGTVRFDAPTNLGSTLINESAKLFERITDPALTVRRITINANKVTPDEGIYQVDFFTDTRKLEKEKKLQQAMLGIKNKYGKNAVLKASSYEEGATMRQRNAQIGGHSAGGSDGKLQK